MVFALFMLNANSKSTPLYNLEEVLVEILIWVKKRVILCWYVVLFSYLFFFWLNCKCEDFHNVTVDFEKKAFKRKWFFFIFVIYISTKQFVMLKYVFLCVILWMYVYVYR